MTPQEIDSLEGDALDAAVETYVFGIDVNAKEETLTVVNNAAPKFDIRDDMNISWFDGTAPMYSSYISQVDHVPLPFHNNLDMCALMESKIKSLGLQVEYCDYLLDAVFGSADWKLTIMRVWDAATASPTARCKAALKAVVGSKE